MSVDLKCGDTVPAYFFNHAQFNDRELEDVRFDNNRTPMELALKEFCRFNKKVMVLCPIYLNRDGKLTIQFGLTETVKESESEKQTVARGILEEFGLEVKESAIQRYQTGYLEVGNKKKDFWIARTRLFKRKIQSRNRPFNYNLVDLTEIPQGRDDKSKTVGAIVYLSNTKELTSDLFNHDLIRVNLAAEHENIIGVAAISTEVLAKSLESEDCWSGYGRNLVIKKCFLD